MSKSKVYNWSSKMTAIDLRYKHVRGEAMDLYKEITDDKTLELNNPVYPSENASIIACRKNALLVADEFGNLSDIPIDWEDDRLEINILLEVLEELSAGNFEENEDVWE